MVLANIAAHARAIHIFWQRGARSCQCWLVWSCNHREIDFPSAGSIGLIANHWQVTNMRSHFVVMQSLFSAKVYWRISWRRPYAVIARCAIRRMRHLVHVAHIWGTAVARHGFRNVFAPAYLHNVERIIVWLPSRENQCTHTPCRRKMFQIMLSTQRITIFEGIANAIRARMWWAGIYVCELNAAIS